MRLSSILEACLYAENLDEIKNFYSDILGLDLYAYKKNKFVFFRIGDSMILIFNPKWSKTQHNVPSHGAVGEGHLCFVVPEVQIDNWIERLHKYGVKIEKIYEWPHGGKSIYFRDPAGNSLEFATPKIWHIPEISFLY